MIKLFNHHQRGITLLEILLVLGILMIIASVAVPSISGASTRADMRAAAENLQYSIRIARNTARMEESIISLNLVSEPGEATQRIVFSSPRLTDKSLVNMELQEYRLNEKITVISDFSSYEFDSRGVVKNPGQIILISRTDESITTEIMVE